MSARTLTIAAEVLLRLGSGRFEVTAQALPDDSRVCDIGVVTADGGAAVGVGLTIESGEFAMFDHSPLPPPIIERIEDEQPTRQDYEALTQAFARLLFQWRFPEARATDAAVAGYFQTDPMAFHVLSALVSRAFHARERLGWSEEKRKAEDARAEQRMRALLAATVYPEAWPEGFGKGLEEVAAIQNEQRPLADVWTCPKCQRQTSILLNACTHCGQVNPHLERDAAGESPAGGE